MIWIPATIAILALLRCFALERQVRRQAYRIARLTHHLTRQVAQEAASVRALSGS